MFHVALGSSTNFTPSPARARAKASGHDGIGSGALTNPSKDTEPQATMSSARLHEPGVLAFPDVTRSSFRQNLVQLDGDRSSR